MSKPNIQNSENPFKVHEHATYRMMIAAFIAAVIFCVPIYSGIYETGPQWAGMFPIVIVSRGIDAMMTFFHEIGHAVTAWFYGYFAIPSFDFFYGGGTTPTSVNRNFLVVIIIYGAFAYGFYLFREFRSMMIILGGILLFQIVTGFTAIHKILMLFMGHGTEALIAGFMLYRAWMNIAPRGGAERFLNAFFGFGFIFSGLITGNALLHYEPMRIAYINQKGGTGDGDFDRIASITGSSGIDGVVHVWMLLNILCLILPFILYLRFTTACKNGFDRRISE